MTTIPAEEAGSNGTNPSASALPYAEVNPLGGAVVNPPGESVNTVTATAPDTVTIERYLTELFLGVPGGIEVCERRGAHFAPRTYVTTPGKDHNRHGGIRQAAEWVTKLAGRPTSEAVYVRMTTLARPPDKGQRGGATNAAAFTNFWADGDIGTDGHAAPKDGDLPNPPDADTMRAIYRAAGLPEPSIEVGSGGGLNWIWLLDAPVDITDPEMRGQVADASRRLQQLIAKTAKEMGYKYGTGVANLDRLMRPPGVVNRKLKGNPRPTTGVFTGARYTYEEFTALLPAPTGPVRLDDGTWVDPATGEVITRFGVSGPSTDGGLRPGDDFNQRADWHELLVRFNWTYSHSTSEGVEYWIRPGKGPGELHGASLGHIPDTLFVFTDGAGVPEWKAYDKFAFYTFTTLYDRATVNLDDKEQVRGMFRLAAADLRAQGYGEQLPSWLPGQRGGEKVDLFAGQLAEDGTVLEGSALADAVAPSMDVTGMMLPPLSDAERSTPEGEADGSGSGPDSGAGQGGGDGDTPERVGDDGASAALPMVDISNERDALHNLVKEIANGALPETYVRDGALVHVGVVSGARNGRRKKEGSAAERIAPNMSPSKLRALIAKNMVTLSYTDKGPKAKLPTESLCKAVLAISEWETLPDLVEITRMPFVRADGTVCQARGYDEDTGIWLNVDDGFPEVPEIPSQEMVSEALHLLLDVVLTDFPWVSAADRANYLALLLTPALRAVFGGLSPFGVITAANAGSGKSLLAEIICRTYTGSNSEQTLSRNDEEIRKMITAKVMNDPSKIITFDNIGKNHTVDSPVLAQLLTSSVWTDRILGGNDVVSRINDKLWLGTGNNVRLGGDMASRSVLVRIDPQVEKPGDRDTTKFAVGNLKTWLAQENNQVKIMHALLVLIRSWASAGMPRAKVEMRTFSTWAQTLGGLLSHHGIEGFLDNIADVDDSDDEAYEWAQFFAAWHGRHAGEWMTTAQLLASYKSTQFEVMSGAVDPWGGAFPVKENGQMYTTHALGAKFKHVQDRPFQGWVLRRWVNTTTNQRMWRPERMPDPSARKVPVYDQMVMAAEGD